MDLIRFGPEAMANSDFLALLFHAERSLAYGKAADAASLSQMTNGVFNRKTRERIRGAAGIGKATCAAANSRLEKKGLIRRVLRYRENGACAPTEYEIQWPRLKQFFTKIMLPAKYPPCPPDGQYSVPHSDSPPVRQTDTPCPPPGQQQSRSYRGDHHQKGFMQPGVSVKASAVRDGQNHAASLQETAFGQKPSTPDTPRIPPQRESGSFSPGSFRSENTPGSINPSRECLADPAQEFMTCLTERGHAEGTDLGHVLRCVQKQLAKSGLTLEGFLRYESGKSTGRSTNPAGMYTQLAKEWQAERDQYEAERQREILCALKKGVQTEKSVNDCPHCANSPLGKGSVTGEDGAWIACSCATPAIAGLIAMMEAQRKTKHESQLIATA
jgi:hypothetical protein